MTEGLKNTERKLLRKILESVKRGEQYGKHRSNKLYSHIEKISCGIKKRIITFYRHSRQTHYLQK